MIVRLVTAWKTVLQELLKTVLLSQFVIMLFKKESIEQATSMAEAFEQHQAQAGFVIVVTASVQRVVFEFGFVLFVVEQILEVLEC